MSFYHNVNWCFFSGGVFCYKVRKRPIWIVLVQYSKQLITRESKATLLYQQNPMGQKFVLCL